MSAPGLTFFCKHGHIVYIVSHGYTLLDDPTECPYCKSKDIKAILEWGDDDYEPFSVPDEPLRTTPFMVDIPVYDVSKLFKED